MRTKKQPGNKKPKIPSRAAAGGCLGAWAQGHEKEKTCQESLVNCVPKGCFPGEHKPQSNLHTFLGLSHGREDKSKSSIVLSTGAGSCANTRSHLVSFHKCRGDLGQQRAKNMIFLSKRGWLRF